MEGILDKLFIYIFLIFAAILLLTLIATPTFLAYLLYRWLRKKKARYIGIILLILAPLWTIYEIYTAIYPRDSFYFSEFKYITLRHIPKSAIILNKAASYPDFHGDYCSASLISLSTQDYIKLLNELADDKQLTKIKATDIIANDEFDKVMSKHKRDQIIQSFARYIPGEEDKYLFIGFLNDNKTIVVSVCIT